MTALAGIIHLDGPEPAPAAAVQNMIDALAHRAPSSGSWSAPGVSMAWRFEPRVAPEPFAANETGEVHGALVGWLSNRAELAAGLTGRGHQIKSSIAGDVLVHSWEETGPSCLEKLRGQFACALWDGRQRTLLLARDRIGMTPLYWTQRGRW